VKTAIFILGGLFLIFMGVGMLRNAGTLHAESAGAATTPFIAGILLSIWNPYFLFWWATVGAALIVKRSSHISIDAATNLLPPGPRRWVLALAHVITLVILSILAVKGFQFLRTTGISASPALGVPWVYVYLAFPIGMSLMVVRYGHSLVLLFRPSTPRDSGLVDRSGTSEGPQRPGGAGR
jgi:hypothetical protein